MKKNRAAALVLAACFALTAAFSVAACNEGGGKDGGGETGKAYTVIFQKGEGTGGSDGAEVTYGQAMPSGLTAPSRKDYNFAGYWDAFTGGTKYYNADMTSARAWDKESGATLYARWETPTDPDPNPVTYTVVFYADEGTGGTAETEVTYGQAMPLGLTAPSRADYSFAGYWDAFTGGTKYYNADMTSARAWDKERGAALYARWEYDGGGAFFGGLVYGFGDWDGDMASYLASNGVHEGVPYVELGKYPKSYVGYALNDELQSAVVAGTAVATGKSYTRNEFKTGYYPEASIEYFYKGEKYARVEYCNFYTNNYPFTTGESTGNGSPTRWMRIEPVRWLIGNWARLPQSINPEGSGAASAMNLLASDLLMSGIPFHGSGPYWADSIHRAFLNDDFMNEAFGQAVRERIPDTEIKISSYTHPGSGSVSPSGWQGTAESGSTDKVFLPSWADLFTEQGMFYSVSGSPNNARIRGRVTDFAIANNVYMHGINTSNSSYRGSIWWTRDSIYYQYYGNLVLAVNDIAWHDGYQPNLSHAGIRPALRVTLPSAAN